MVLNCKMFDSQQEVWKEFLKREIEISSGMICGWKLSERCWRYT